MTQIAQVQLPTLTPDQQTVFNTITSLIDERVTNFLQSYNIQDYIISLTDAAGTGKTFLTVQIVKHLIEKYSAIEYGEFLKHNFVVTAPTHKAVSMIAGIHKNKIFKQIVKLSTRFQGSNLLSIMIKEQRLLQ
ncbi:MAG: hypothetical protein QM497_00775 [Sulfurimonas sp.]